jgi:ABC-type sugar transport system ATPase subunit
MAGVGIRNVKKAYGSVGVIHGVDIEVDDGEFVILVGPSGCGKSTLLRMVAGLENITGGEIRIGSRVVNNVPPKERDIAMVFQNYALYPHMTVAANMAFSLMLKKAPRSEIDAKVNRAAEILGLTKLSTATRASSPAASASGWPWAGPSCATRRCSCSTSRSPTWTPSCGCPCAARSRPCTSAWPPPPCT